MFNKLFFMSSVLVLIPILCPAEDVEPWGNVDEAETRAGWLNNNKLKWTAGDIEIKIQEIDERREALIGLIRTNIPTLRARRVSHHALLSGDQSGGDQWWQDDRNLRLNTLGGEQFPYDQLKDLESELMDLHAESQDFRRNNKIDRSKIITDGGAICSLKKVSQHHDSTPAVVQGATSYTGHIYYVMMRCGGVIEHTFTEDQIEWIVDAVCQGIDEAPGTALGAVASESFTPQNYTWEWQDYGEGEVSVRRFVGALECHY